MQQIILPEIHLKGTSQSRELFKYFGGSKNVLSAA